MKVALACVTLALSLGIAPAGAQPVPRHYNLNIPRQTLDAALKEFAEQTGLQIARFGDTGDGNPMVGPVTGELSLDHALRSLLGTSHLTFRIVNDRTIAIVRDDASVSRISDVHDGLVRDDDTPSRSQYRESPASDSLSRLAQAGEPSRPRGSGPAALEEIVVTGSRISGTTSLTSASPVAVATHEDIVLSKATNIEEVLSRMPGLDFNGGQSSANNNGAGTSVIALRNLGPQRTLVLLDGQRLIPQFGGSVDLNIIPLAMIDHIEVLKDGASSIYGADAIGGVINLITRKHADGLTLESNYGASDRGDAQTYGVAATVGANTERGNVFVGLAWNHRAPLPQNDRDWAVAMHGDDPNYPGGSAWRARYPFLQDEYNPSRAWIGAPNSGVTADLSDPAVAAKARNLGFIAGLGQVELNSGGAGWNYLTKGHDQKQISLASHYELIDGITAALDGFYTHSGVRFRVTPDNLVGDLIASPAYAGFIIPATNPYNVSGSDIAGILIPDQFGPRDFSESSQVYRMRAGFEGKLARGWKWETGYVFQHNTTTFTIGNQANLLNLAQITGQVPCVNVPGGCTNGLPSVAVNFFNGPNLFTAEQVDFLTYDNTSLSHETETYFYGDISGALFDLPYGPLSAAVGFESRHEHYDNEPDELSQAGYAGGGVSLPTSGGYSVSSAYLELRVPLLKDMPFARSLSLTPSARYDDFSEFGGRTTYKLGLEYRPWEDIRFRAAYSTAIRAPQVTELFSGTTIGFPSASGDPCETNPAYAANGNFGKGLLAAGSTCSLAVAGGGAVTHYVDPIDAVANAQIQTLQGGNRNLQPEKARTFTGGFVLTPGLAPGLTAAVDYYNVDLTDTVLTSGIAGSVGADFLLNGCYGPAQNAQFCREIVRDSRGNLIQVNSTATNIGAATARGIDYEISYDTRAAGLYLPHIPGSFVLDLALTNQLASRQTNPDGSVTNFNGFFNANNQTVQPKWKGIFTVDYQSGPMKLRYDVRYSRHTWDLQNGVASGVYGDRVPDLYYHDLSASYDLPGLPGLKSGRVILGVDNLFAREPPFVALDNVCRCNTIAGPFDMVGRNFYLRLSIQP